MSVIEYTREELLAKADAEFQELLCCSYEEARRAVSIGWYRGTLVEQKVRQYEWLLS